MVAGVMLGLFKIVSRYPCILLTEFQLMSDVLCKLAFQSSLFFFLRHVYDGNFEGVILKNNTFLLRTNVRFCRYAVKIFFLPYENFPSFRFRKSVIGASSGMEKTSSVEVRLWSDIVFAY